MRSGIRNYWFIRQGFTIVELLIVVVVIAILASIVIVSYNGISDRAKISAITSAVEQAFKKVSLYAISNDEISPANLGDAGVVDEGAVSYQYRTYDDGKNYCITATMDTKSYFVDSAGSRTPQEGACPGHGVGGKGTVTNLAQNPSFETNIASSAQMGGTGRDSSVTRTSSWSSSGTWSLEVEKTATENIPKGIRIAIPVALSPGDVVRWSATVKNINSTARSFHAYGERSAPSYAPLEGGASVSVPAGGVRTVNGQITITTANSGSAGSFGFGVIPEGVYAIGEGYLIDGFIITVNQPLPEFADGSTTGWIWNGNVNNSTSTGPVL